MSLIEKVMDKLDSDELNERERKKTCKDNSHKNSANTLDNINNGKQVRKSNNSIELDFGELDNLGILTPDTINTKLSEQLRRIKQPLLKNAFGNTILNVEIVIWSW